MPILIFGCWDTENYSFGKSAVSDNTSVPLTLICKRFSSPFTVAQVNEIESAPALSKVTQRDTENYRPVFCVKNATFVSST